MNWKEIVNRIFPRQVSNNFQGYRIASIIFLLIIAVTIARSCVHIFAPDGGAGSIAGIIVSVEGGSNIISLFALWGLSQLLMGFVYLVVYLRYKSLIPFMYLLIIAEYSGRALIGFTKPLQVTHIPPGAIGDYILIPLALIMLILSLKSPKKVSQSNWCLHKSKKNEDSILLHIWYDNLPATTLIPPLRNGFFKVVKRRAPCLWLNHWD